MDLASVVMHEVNLRQELALVCPASGAGHYRSESTDRAIRIPQHLGGGANFLQKPFNPAALNRKLSEWMGAGLRQ